ncbi:MAG: Response regulator containing a CheY-like receiver domain and a domain protein [Bacteroidetes bacterium]|jgi:ligand-binding sensor domain-containing protein/serine phosphatase RsbU (regulator of sigma subunit)|nr:Response regulator containing a CheY-like receiver domain and a domain protein [Bacteroidota bacterium]
MCKKLKILCLVFLHAICISAVAQQYNFKNYTPKNGLVGSVINNIFQDSKGFIWFGAQGGVSRFDGKNFKNFTKENGLVANDVTFITEDRKGNIWIATSEGVSMFDGLTLKNYNNHNGLQTGEGIYWIYIDENNNKWFAIRGVGVLKFDDKKFTYLTDKDNLPSNNVFCISQDSAGDLWFGLSNGIAKYDGTRVTSYDKEDVVNNKTAFATLFDSKGQIWFAGAEGFVVKRHNNKFEKIDLPKEVAGDFIGSITEDKKGNIWFATNHGLLKLEKDNFKLFTEEKGLSNNEVLGVATDYEGNIWVGTQSGGVNVFNNESFVSYSDNDGLTSKVINCIIQDEEGKYLCGTPGSGINIYDKNRSGFTSINNIPEISKIVIRTLFIDRQNDLWIGAQEGIFVLSKSGEGYKLKKVINKFGGRSITGITKIIQDNNGIYWISSYGDGVYRIEGDKVTVYNNDNGFISENVLTIFQDFHSIIWIGTLDAGLIKYDGQRFINYTEKDGLADKSVWAINEDDKGNLFFGTGESGISCFDGKKFKTINIKDGLCSNHINLIEWDSFDKSFWIGTDFAINKIRLNSNFSIQELRYYGEQEGYKGTEVIQNAGLVDSQGLVWFGTNNGLSCYNRKYDFINSTPPKIAITGIRLSFQNVDWKNYTDTIDRLTTLPAKLVLSYQHNHLTFDFQALTTDNVKYSYILEGQDENWSPESPRTEAVFGNINPGKTYTFKVKALNSQGIWSKEFAAFTFKIEPPWWKTWWFRISFACLVILSVLGIFRWRTASLRKDKERLESIIVERTAEVVLQKDEAEKQRGLVEEKNHEITDSINYALHIQKSILPPLSEVFKAFPKSFVLYKPKDIVSGDFYWFVENEDGYLIAAADCTGHGVPGAFMSVISSEKLTISAQQTSHVSEILNMTNRGIKKSLRQNNSDDSTRDGMDVCICHFDKGLKTVTYAGANRPLWLIRKNVREITEIKATKTAIGGLTSDDQTFESNMLKLSEGDTIYLFTDGYSDQFSSDDKKLMTKRFKEALLSSQHMTMEEQKIFLDKYIMDWKGTMEQTDDILVIGIRV